MSSPPLTNTIWERMIKNKLYAVIIPALVVHAIWWPYIAVTDSWSLFDENYFMTLTMTIGSFIAGATSEGGGAIAYPVMTLWCQIDPQIARDFSLMIQSVGMIAAATSIIITKTKIEWSCIKWVTFGGTIGLLFSLNYISPYLSPPHAKISFVSIWFAFAFALWLLNRKQDRDVFEKIPSEEKHVSIFLTVTGIIGGIFTGIAGSGLDICCFCFLTLYFRVSEKIATPTSVVLMGIISVVGFAHQFYMQVIVTDAWNYWLVSIPVVPIGAPCGAMAATVVSRLTLARAVYFLCSIQLLTGFAIILPKKPILSVMSLSIMIAASVIFMLLARIGDIRLSRMKKRMSAPSLVPLSNKTDLSLPA